jgi:hypothetical protein
VNALRVPFVAHVPSLAARSDASNATAAAATEAELIEQVSVVLSGAGQDRAQPTRRLMTQLNLDRDASTGDLGVGFETELRGAAETVPTDGRSARQVILASDAVDGHGGGAGTLRLTS